MGKVNACLTPGPCSLQIKCLLISFYFRVMIVVVPLCRVRFYSAAQERHFTPKDSSFSDNCDIRVKLVTIIKTLMLDGIASFPPFVAIIMIIINNVFFPPCWTREFQFLLFAYTRISTELHMLSLRMSRDKFKAITFVIV